MSDTPSQVELVEQLYDENKALKERIKRLEDIIKRAGYKFFEDGTDGRIAVNMLTILDEAREAKP
jgi:dissimilatory sulfite reductase (desulfoviridin) alpha/beta subunit